MMILIIGCSAYILGFIFTPRSQGPANNQQNSNLFYSLYDNGEDIDVLILGSSQTFAGIQPICLYEEFGITSFNWGNSVQSPIVAYAKLRDAKSRHDIKLVILAATQLFSDYEVDNTKVEPSIRKAIDSMRWSRYKASAVLDIAKRSKQQSVISYMFPFLRYHSRILEIDEKSFEFSYFREPLPPITMGAYAKESIVELEYPEDWMKKENGLKSASEDSVVLFNKIVNYCKNNNIEILLVRTASCSGWSYEFTNTVSNYSASKGIHFIDCNTPDLANEIGIDPKTDFYDPGHLNIGGAWKTSLYLGKYIQDKFNLNDWRTENNILWEEAVNGFYKMHGNFEYFYNKQIENMSYEENININNLLENTSLSIAEKDSNFNYSVLYTTFEPLSTYEFTVSQVDLSPAEAQSFSAMLYDRSTRRVLDSIEFAADDFEEQTFYFSTNINTDSVALYVYAGAKGSTAGVQLKISQMKLFRTGTYIASSDMVSGDS